MATSSAINNEPASGASAAKVDMKFEVVVIPVTDVDRSKAFYTRLGWRLDADFPFDNGFRVVQFTPGSGCSVQSASRRPRPHHKDAPGRRKVFRRISKADTFVFPLKQKILETKSEHQSSPDALHLVLIESRDQASQFILGYCLDMIEVDRTIGRQSVCRR